jgi:hypothetical protein
MLATSPTLLLSACGGDDLSSSSTSTTPTQSPVPTTSPSPTGTPPAAKTPVGGVGYLFDSTDSRLLSLVSPAGAWGTYLGTYDSAGNPSTVSSFVYDDPDSTQNFVINLSIAQYDVLMATGDRFTVIQTGSNYAFTIFSAAANSTYSGTYDPATKTISPSSLPVTLAKSAQRSTCAYVVSKTEETTGTIQPIFLKVIDDCGNVISAGTASATVRADPSAETQQVGEELIKLPPIPVSLKFDSAQSGFSGFASINDLKGNLNKLSKDLFDKGAKIIVDALGDIGTDVAADAILDLIPVAGEAAIFFQVAQALFKAGDTMQKIGDIVENAETAWDIGEDLYKLASGPNPALPIDVTVSYSNGSFHQSETQAVNPPGSTPAEFSFSIDTGAPCLNGGTIAGNWVGSLTQPNGPITDLFQFAMSFQVDGSTVTGGSETVNGSTFAIMSLDGTITGDRLQFDETGITSQIAPPNGAVWCLKTGVLTLSGSGSNLSLSGNWTAISPPGCLPGAINLTKVVATS